MKDTDKRQLADQIFDGVSAQSWIEDELDDLFPDYLHHIGHDYYDQSLELYFNNNVPLDFTVNDEQVEEMAKWGFYIIYCNFTNNSEQIVSIDRDDKTRTSKRIMRQGYDRGWNEETCNSKQSEF